jgi:hypothetical protein
VAATEPLLSNGRVYWTVNSNGYLLAFSNIHYVQDFFQSSHLVHLTTAKLSSYILCAWICFSHVVS